MIDKNDLKIEFRAVPYGDNYYALQYRINPKQDLEYIKKVSLLWGLIKFDWKTKYSTKWKDFELFTNRITSYLYESDDMLNWSPILIKNQSELDFYKHEYKTWGQWSSYIDRRHKKEMAKYTVERENYLKNRHTLY